ncbi:MAG: hypothetical protein QXK65_01420 [Candidatus Micrarchaeaceae archaeon]
MRRIFAFAFALALLTVNYSSAAAILTMTGTCRIPVLNPSNNTIYFYLSGTGNASATNLELVPRFTGVSISPPSETLSSFAPNENVSFSFNTSNFSTPGSYAGAFILEYAQGASTFITLFPCEYSIEKPTQSLLNVISMNVSRTRLSAAIFSLEDQAVNASIYVLAPPLFSVSPSVINVTMPPNSNYNATFSLKTSSLSAGTSLPVGLVVSYVKNGLHYSTISIGHIYFQAPPKINTVDIFVGLLAVAVVVILALILVAAIRNRRERVHRAGEKIHERRHDSG